MRMIAVMVVLASCTAGKPSTDSSISRSTPGVLDGGDAEQAAPADGGELGTGSEPTSESGTESVKVDAGIVNGEAGSVNADTGSVNADAGIVKADAGSDAGQPDPDASTDQPTDAGQDAQTDAGPPPDSGPDPCDPPPGVVYDCAEQACDARPDWTEGWVWCGPWSCAGDAVPHLESAAIAVLLPGFAEVEGCKRCSGTDLRLRWHGEAPSSTSVMVRAPEGSLVLELPNPCSRVGWSGSCLVVPPRGEFVVVTERPYGAGWLAVEPGGSCD